MKDKYVLDSCLWIEIERKNKGVLSEAQPLINRNEVCLVDVIVAEVLRGVKTRKDYLKLKDAFSHFVQLSTSWDRVAKLAFQVSRKGFQPPLVDLYIAQCVLENGKTLLTQDKHFLEITKVHPFSVKIL